MSQQNVSLNTQLTNTRVSTDSFYQMHSQHSEQSEAILNPKPLNKLSNSYLSPVTKPAGFSNAKRLANILEQKGNGKNVNARGTLSETFKSSSFHLPVHDSSLTKNAKYNLDSLKPVTFATEFGGEERYTNLTLDESKLHYEQAFKSLNNPQRSKISSIDYY